MKIKHLVVFSLLILLMSCNDAENAEQTQPIEEISSEVLGTSESSSKLPFSSRSYKESIITQLFEEALGKNKALRTLLGQIRIIQNAKNDSTKIMDNFLETNETYYNDAFIYLEDIEDTIVRAQTRLIFEQFQKQFEANTVNEQGLLELINEKSERLEQQLTLMELYVANEMMKNYQKDNLPNTKPLEDLIKNYDILIQETEKYVK